MYLGEARIHYPLPITKTKLTQNLVTEKVIFKEEKEKVFLKEDEAEYDYDTEDTRSAIGETPDNNENDAEYENKSQSISEILNLDIPAYTAVSDEVGSGKRLYECEECESVFKSRQCLWSHSRKHEGVVYSFNMCK
jgi:hypothetical protein